MPIQGVPIPKIKSVSRLNCSKVSGYIRRLLMCQGKNKEKGLYTNNITDGTKAACGKIDITRRKEDEYRVKN